MQFHNMRNPPPLPPKSYGPNLNYAPIASPKHFVPTQKQGLNLPNEQMKRAFQHNKLSVEKPARSPIVP